MVFINGSQLDSILREYTGLKKNSVNVEVQELDKCGGRLMGSLYGVVD
jgi:hypothetical protein